VVPLISRSGTESPRPGRAGIAPDRLLLHDLGQPLAAIRALAWTPLPPAGGSAAAEAADRLRRIAELAELMTALVGSAEPDPDRAAGAPADVAAVVLDVVVSAAPGFAGRLRCRAGDPAAVPVDPLHLRRAVGNLVDNAARAAGPDGRVDVGVLRDGDRVRIEVGDDGPGFGGLPPQTGRGLAVALDVAASCGGVLEIQDVPEGGARVRLELPLAASDARA
jgi:signal transduction histidine kinase